MTSFLRPAGPQKTDRSPVFAFHGKHGSNPFERVVKREKASDPSTRGKYMATDPVLEFLQRLRRTELLRGGEDGQLLEGFVRRQDRLALEALVQRHAPMVWGVCRRTLANYHDAEDAFQATFLVLVRKAVSIRSRGLLANWLHGVAQKTARKARQMAAKRAAREKQPTVLPEPQPVAPQDADLGPELRPLLDEELSRIPDKYRIVILLCDLEGRSRPEAAQQLRLPEGTVGSRLARGRALLARRLARRGLNVLATSLGVVLAHEAASGAVPAALLANAIQAATLCAANDVTAAGAISVQVSTLTKGVLRTMTLAKRKAVCIVLLTAALVLAGGIVSYQFVPGPPFKPEPPPGGRNGDMAKVDVVKYGSEADARRFAEDWAAEMIAARLAGMPGLPEVLQQGFAAWSESAARPSKIKFDPQGGARHRSLASLEAKLDPDKGQWTVIGVFEFWGDDRKAWEVDWKMVVQYSPATGQWQCVSYWTGMDAPDAFRDPARYWRPVIRNVGKDGG
jgi:RNA polymerase sigma factor (sigma-70 family)